MQKNPNRCLDILNTSIPRQNETLYRAFALDRHSTENLQYKVATYLQKWNCWKLVARRQCHCRYSTVSSRNRCSSRVSFTRRVDPMLTKNYFEAVPGCSVLLLLHKLELFIINNNATTSLPRLHLSQRNNQHANWPIWRDQKWRHRNVREGNFRGRVQLCCCPLWQELIRPLRKIKQQYSKYSYRPKRWCWIKFSISSAFPATPRHMGQKSSRAPVCYDDADESPVCSPGIVAHFSSVARKAESVLSW